MRLGWGDNFAKLFVYVLICFCTSLSAAPSLLDHKWVLLSINENQIDVAQHLENPPYISLKSDNRYSAYAGCNRIIGGFTLVDKQIAFLPNSAMTKMACTNNQDLENDFVSMLGRVKFWSIDGNILTFKSATYGVVARFKY